MRAANACADRSREACDTPHVANSLAPCSAATHLSPACTIEDVAPLPTFPFFRRPMALNLTGETRVITSTADETIATANRVNRHQRSNQHHDPDYHGQATRLWCSMIVALLPIAAPAAIEPGSCPRRPSPPAMARSARMNPTRFLSCGVTDARRAQFAPGSVDRGGIGPLVPEQHRYRTSHNFEVDGK